MKDDGLGNGGGGADTRSLPDDGSDERASDGRNGRGDGTRIG